jgi:hypothetical protein
MIAFQPHAKVWLKNYDKFVDADGKTTLNAAEQTEFRSMRVVKAKNDAKVLAARKASKLKMLKEKRAPMRVRAPMHEAPKMAFEDFDESSGFSSVVSTTMNEILALLFPEYEKIVLKYKSDLKASIDKKLEGDSEDTYELYRGLAEKLRTEAEKQEDSAPEV